MNIIGIRKEEKAFERRVPIIPEHVKTLIRKHKLSIIVEPSDQRAFSAHEFEKSGATIAPLYKSKANVIFGIKEMPLEFFEPDKVYIFFSHTIKGQSYNMPMLKKLIDHGATLIDYERIVDDHGRRLIFFGNWAGIAGMYETLRLLGERLQTEGISPNPFFGIKPALDCDGLDELKSEIHALGQRILERGLPAELQPFVVGFAGYGNVSRGAQELFDILPHESVEPANLETITPDSHTLYKCVFKEEHMVKPIDASAAFDLQDYYDTGSSKYRGVFENYVPYLTVLMNCIFWTEKYPRLLTSDFIRTHWHSPNRKLRIIGDISCDIRGAIEFTIKCTTPGHPGFTYIPTDDKALVGVDGDGPVVMAVDNLPAELPKESSRSFSETLLRFIPDLAKADFTVAFKDLELPQELKRAIIVYRGNLTNDYSYLNKYLTKL